MSDIIVQVLRGQQIVPCINELAQLRMQIFRDYPYLYQGDMDYEKNYLQNYSRCTESVLVLVLDKDKIVGAATATPLKAADEYMQQPFQNQPFSLQAIFYYGESVLLPTYRGQGLGKRFFQERELIARQEGYCYATFCAVERAVDDPRKPVDYRPLDSFWCKQGFIKHPEICGHFSWQEIDEPAESLKRMVYWIKRL